MISMRRKQGRTPILQISNSPKRSRAGLATKKGNEELNARATFKFHCIKYLGRIRLVVFVLFWMIVAGHTVLYFDSLTCWFEIPTNTQQWAEWVYGERMPPNSCIQSIPERFTRSRS